MEKILCDYFNQVIRNDGTGIVVDWKRIKEDTESDDLQIAAMGRKAIRILVFLKVLTPVKKGSWRFADLKMNPYFGPIDDFSAEKGRVFFRDKKTAIEYGSINWIWRMDNWAIVNGKRKVTRLRICQ